MDKDNKDEKNENSHISRKLLILIVVILFLIPTVLCVVLFVKYSKLSDEIDRIRQLKIERILVAQKRNSETEMLASMLRFAQVEADKKKALMLKAEEEERIRTARGRVYLTFDDGPSENTEDVLKILKKNDIKATFFVIGRTDKKSLEMYKKIVNDGHTIAMHSYTHNYGLIYASLKNFKKDYYAISDLIYNTTGVRCKYYRFPGGSSNSVSKIDMSLPIKFLRDEGVEYVDWNVMSGDAVRISLSDKVLYKNVMAGVHSMKNSVVLMHDSLARGTTVRALPKIIKSLKKENYLILPIDETTPVVHHRIRKFS